MNGSPIEAVFLGLDPAKHRSGAVILVPDYGNPLSGDDPHPFDGRYYAAEFGKVESQDERGRFVEVLLETAQEHDLPAVVVAEEWDPPRDKKVRTASGGWATVKDPKWNYKTILGIGEGWGLWNAELLNAAAWLAEEGLPPLIIERMTPNDWRDAFFGTGRAKNSEALEAAAIRSFEHIFGFAASGDIAEAGCIAMVGTRSESVLSALSSRQKAKKPSGRKRPKKAS